VAGGLFSALVAASCGGTAFTSAGASGASGDASGALGGSAGDSSLAGRDAGGSGTALGGTSANGDAGASANGDAGASANGDAGAGNVSGGNGCTALGGYAFGGHCYVDATVASVSQPLAVAACEKLAIEGKASGHLLVLNSAEEQSFVLQQFLVHYTDVSDAWLGLTCSERAQPDINACFCSGCTKSVLAEKQRAWVWLDGESSAFGWVNANPNAGFRCAALAYNPESTIWGWVDRQCDKVSVAPISGHPHGYRTLCELEP